MSWYFAVLKKYAVFNGRARRKEFWMFALFNFILSYLFMVLDCSFGYGLRGLFYIVGFNIFDLFEFCNVAPFRLFVWIYTLAVLLPATAVSVRRLHDIGKSGWWYLLILIPIIGTIWILFYWVTDGQSGTNQYGPNPKEMVRAEI